MWYLKLFPRFIRKQILKKQEQKQRIKLQNQLDEAIESFLRSNNLVGGGVNRKGEIIVSLTSYPKRIPYIKYTIYTLLKQTLKPKRLLLWLSKEEFPKLDQDLPSELLAFREYGLEIKWCDKNLYAFKKLIPALREFPDSTLVTADDDVLYPADWLQKLYTAYKKDPQLIHCHRAHRITFDQHNNIKPYLKWESCIKSQATIPSFLNFFTGAGGVLYPKYCLYQDIYKEDVFMRLCPKADDIWFWSMAVLNGTKINVVENNIANIQSSFMDFDEVGQLFESNQRENDAQLQAVLEVYPALKERIAFNSNEYWEIRYKCGIPTFVDGDKKGIGPSGSGSYNNLAEFKAEILNGFVCDNHINSIIEWGVGDGNQLSLAKYPSYIGVDVSPTIIAYLKEKFAIDTTKDFYELSDFLKKECAKVDLSISLDVIYHLIDDDVFENYMHNLFNASRKFVIVYASNKDEFLAQHVKHRKFSDWVEKKQKEWELIQVIPNRYPYDEKNPDFTSFADFYIYQCRG